MNEKYKLPLEYNEQPIFHLQQKYQQKGQLGTPTIKLLYN